MRSEDVRITTARAYDRIVDEYVRRNTDVHGDFVEHRDAFRRAVVVGGYVADVGCGPGRDSTHFQTHGLRIVGIDASRAMARHARAEDVPVILADMRSMPIARASLDGIWSAASLLHVPYRDVGVTVGTWRRLLVPNGVLGLSTSLGTGEGWEPCPYDPAARHEAHEVRRWFAHHDENALLQLIEDAGFEIMSSRVSESNRRWLQLLGRARA